MFSLVHVLVGVDTGAATLGTAIGTFVFSLAAGSLMAGIYFINGASLVKARLAGM